MLSANYSDFSSISILLLCICCPLNAAIFHPPEVSFFVYIVRKIAAILHPLAVSFFVYIVRKIAAILHPLAVSFFVYIVRKIAAILLRRFFPFLSILSSNWSDVSYFHNFRLCLYCPHNTATFHTAVVSFFLYMLSANYSDFTSARSFLLCVCCPQNSAILHPLAVSFFVFIVRKITAILLRRFFFLFVYFVCKM